MKKALYLIIATTMVVAQAKAKKWSLDSCISYAIEHNTEVQQRILSAYEGELDINEAKSRFLPNISAYASQSFNFGRALTADNTYANRNTNSFGVGAQLSLPIFQGLKAIRNLEYSKMSMRALLEQVEASKDDVTLNVTGQYLQALYTRELLDVAKIRLEISNNELARRKELLKAGKIPELDIYEAEAQVSQDELAVINALNDSDMALLDLAQLLNLADLDNFDIADLDEANLPLISPDDIFTTALLNNHAIQAGRINNEAAQKYVEIAKSGYIPTLSFSAGLGTNYYKTSGLFNDSFGQQMRHNFAKSIGFSLNVPVFDAFATRNSVRRAKARLSSAALQLEESHNQLYKAINQAYAQAVAAEKKLTAAEKALEATEAAFHAMEVKYSNGRANATEFEKAKADYITSLAESVQAKYEAILRSRILNFYNKE
ncbi:MAG: TolC family protein [Muribaculaceae bacterium]|nr:TolC family protein [Muribaculaceae bacterium]